jgi:hypothetical protein
MEGEKVPQKIADFLGSPSIGLIFLEARGNPFAGQAENLANKALPQ